MSVFKEGLRLFGILCSLSIYLVHQTCHLYLAAFLIILLGWLLSLLARVAGYSTKADLLLYAAGTLSVILYLAAIVAYS